MGVRLFNPFFFTLGKMMPIRPFGAMLALFQVVSGCFESVLELLWSCFGPIKVSFGAFATVWGLFCAVLHCFRRFRAIAEQ
jgi:hypothetical protein